MLKHLCLEQSLEDCHFEMETFGNGRTDDTRARKLIPLQPHARYVNSVHNKAFSCSVGSVDGNATCITDRFQNQLRLKAAESAPPATLPNGDKCDIYNGIREAVTQHTVHGFSGDPAATPRSRVRVKPALFPLIWCRDGE